MVTSQTASKTKNPHFMEVSMIARFVEINIKLDRKAEIIKKVKEEVLPILRKYDGSVKTFVRHL